MKDAFKNKFQIFLSFFIIFSFSLAQETILDEYVNRPDSTFSLTHHYTIDEDGFNTYILELYSQTWRSTADVDRAHWQHWVNIVVPDNATNNKALLLIAGGSNGGSVPSTSDESLVSLALLSNSVVIELRMIPNEPVQFTDETFTRSEDAIIAYTWDKYLNTGDTDWPLQLPMVKSVVKAMDGIQQFFDEELQLEHLVEEFVLFGGSKRGWTTWLTAVVDDRVHSIMPAVFDALNLLKSFKHHYGAYGFWSEAVNDYEEAGIFDRFIEPEIYDLMDIVDPLSYVDRLDMPKFLIHSAGDEFFVPSSQFYFDQLQGIKYQRYVANSSHGLDQQFDDVIVSIMAFYRAMLNDYSLPEFSWTMEENGSIRFETETDPMSVKLWVAHNPNEFDFRYYSVGAIWQDSLLTEIEPGVYVGEIPIPDSGYSALFIEASYSSVSPYYFTFSTDVSFLPKQLPHATDITFSVIDSLGGWDNYYIIGDASSNLPFYLHDDGVNGDEFANDGIWAGTIPFVLDGSYSWEVHSIIDGIDYHHSDNTLLEFEVVNGSFSGQNDFVNTNQGPLEIQPLNMPSQLALFSSYPNPFNPTTTIRFSINRKSETSIHIFDITGKMVHTLSEGTMDAGMHEIQWNASVHASGVYYVQLTSGNKTEVQKILLLK